MKIVELDNYFIILKNVNKKLDYLNNNQLEVVIDNQDLSIELLSNILIELKKFNKTLEELGALEEV